MLTATKSSRTDKPTNVSPQQDNRFQKYRTQTKLVIPWKSQTFCSRQKFMWPTATRLEASNKKCQAEARLPIRLFSGNNTRRFWSPLNRRNWGSFMVPSQWLIRPGWANFPRGKIWLRKLPSIRLVRAVSLKSLQDHLMLCSNTGP